MSARERGEGYRSMETLQYSSNIEGLCEGKGLVEWASKLVFGASEGDGEQTSKLRQNSMLAPSV